MCWEVIALRQMSWGGGFDRDLRPLLKGAFLGECLILRKIMADFSKEQMDLTAQLFNNMITNIVAVKFRRQQPFKHWAFIWFSWSSQKWTLDIPLDQILYIKNCYLTALVKSGFKMVFWVVWVVRVVGKAISLWGRYHFSQRAKRPQRRCGNGAWTLCQCHWSSIFLTDHHVYSHWLLVLILSRLFYFLTLAFLNCAVPKQVYENF